MLLHNTGQVKPDFYPIINSTQLLYVFFHPGPAVEEHSAAHSQRSGIMTTLNKVGAHPTLFKKKKLVLISLIFFFIFDALFFFLLAAILFFKQQVTAAAQ